MLDRQILSKRSNIASNLLVFVFLILLQGIGGYGDDVAQEISGIKGLPFNFSNGVR
jgi:hypothetical protein